MKRLVCAGQIVLLILFAVCSMARAQRPEVKNVRTYRVKCYTEKQRKEVFAKAKVVNLLRAILEDDEKEILDLEKYRQLDEQLQILGYKKE